MPLYAFEDRTPQIASSSYISPTAQLIGHVTIGERCYIGHGAILRGDYGSISVGDETAVEEGVIIHARPSDWTRIGRRVTIGHGAMVHNATIEDGAVIGMRAVVSDFSTVGEGAIIGEMTLVRRGQQIPARKTAVGVPARVTGNVEERHSDMSHWAKELYVSLAARYGAGAMVQLPARQGGALPPLVSIGVIRSGLGDARGAPIQGALAPEQEGEVLIHEAYREGLADLDGFSHVVLLYACDRVAGYRLKVTPYLDHTVRGLFATRAPRRPNPIGMTVVRLLEVTPVGLRIGGVDMLDGSPLLDIKPHVPDIDCPGEVRTGWLGERLEERRRAGQVPLADDRFHQDEE